MLGFTLIEVMIVVSVISIVAAIAFTGFGKNLFESAFRRFTDDAAGGVMRARDIAIDEQTLVSFNITASELVITWTDPLTQVAGDSIWASNMTAVPGTLEEDGTLSSDASACVYGLFAGVQMYTGQVASSVSTVPTTCVTGTQALNFFPDGHFEWEGTNLNGAGVTLVIADQRSDSVKATHIQVYPGGLIRKIDNVVDTAGGG